MIVKEVHSSGAPQTQTLSGNVSIESTPGQIIVRSGSLARILIGAHPVDGHAGLWISKENVDVIEELKGGA